MIETLFGSAPPMWAPQLFGSPTVLGSGGLPIGPQPLQATAGLPTQTYGYGGIAQGPTINLAGQSYGAPSFFPPSPASVLVGPLGGDATAGVTVQALLVAVAMRRGQPQGPTTDQEIEDFVYDALELLPNASDVEVRCEGGRTTLTGSVSHKRIKRDIGEILWAIPTVNDVQNNVAIASRRRARTAGRETEPPSTTSSRKQG